MDRAVREGRAKSRNKFLHATLRRESAVRERARVDETFGLMTHDPLYRGEAEELANEFDDASWKALRNTERTSTRRDETGG